MLANALAGLVAEDENLVFHYCDSRSFLSLLENGCLWASDLRSMNDPREIGDGKRILDSFLQGLEFAVGSPNDEFRKQVLERLKLVESLTRSFCTSFTGLKDDLYSWLNYGDKGAGFCIGFRRDYFSDILWHNVTYSDQQYRAKVKKIWASSLTNYAGCAADDEEAKKSVISRATFELQDSYSAFKHASWAAENEMRLLFPVIRTEDDKEFRIFGFYEDYIKGGKVRYRSTHRGIRPYLTVSVKEHMIDDVLVPSAIAQVILGPNNMSEIEVVESVLAEAGFAALKIDKSDCKFVV